MRLELLRKPRLADALGQRRDLRGQLRRRLDRRRLPVGGVGRLIVLALGEQVGHGDQRRRVRRIEVDGPREMLHGAVGVALPPLHDRPARDTGTRCRETAGSPARRRCAPDRVGPTTAADRAASITCSTVRNRSTSTRRRTSASDPSAASAASNAATASASRFSASSVCPLPTSAGTYCGAVAERGVERRERVVMIAARQRDVALARTCRVEVRIALQHRLEIAPGVPRIAALQKPPAEIDPRRSSLALQRRRHGRDT